MVFKSKFQDYIQVYILNLLFWVADQKAKEAQQWEVAAKEAQQWEAAAKETQQWEAAAKETQQWEAAAKETQQWEADEIAAKVCIVMST